MRDAREKRDARARDAKGRAPFPPQDDAQPRRLRLEIGHARAADLCAFLPLQAAQKAVVVLEIRGQKGVREIRLVPLFRLSAVAERAAQTAREIPPPGRDPLALRLRARVFLKQREDVSRAGGARRVRSGVGHLPAVTAVKVHAAAHRAKRLRLAQGEEDEQSVLRVHDGEIGQAVSERLRRAAQNGRGKRLVPEHIPRVLPARPREKPVEKVPAHLCLCERGVVGEEIGTSAREERPAADGDVEARLHPLGEAGKVRKGDEVVAVAVGDDLPLRRERARDARGQRAPVREAKYTKGRIFALEKGQIARGAVVREHDLIVGDVRAQDAVQAGAKQALVGVLRAHHDAQPHVISPP